MERAFDLAAVQARLRAALTYTYRAGRPWPWAEDNGAVPDLVTAVAEIERLRAALRAAHEWDDFDADGYDILASQARADFRAAYAALMQASTQTAED